MQMSKFLMISRYFVNPRSRACKSLLAVAALTALSVFDAAPALAAGPHDGSWTAVFATTRGNCSSGLSLPFLVRSGRVFSNGGGRVSGTVSRSGSIAVAASLGASHATGGGRVVGNSASGRWSGLITGDRCSGTWQATRG
jgi:hypothetical protein